MDELLQELQTARQLVEFLKAKKTLLTEREEAVTAREKAADDEENDLAARELAVAELQKAQDVWSSIKKAQDRLYADTLALDKAQADFQNKTVAIQEEIRVRQEKAQEVQDQADQVRRDKIALENEKATYKQKIMDEFKAKLGA